jgi:hypothetical protein
MRLLVLVTAALAASAAAGQAPSGGGSGRAAPIDENQVICQRIQVIGSRLHVQRTCLTRGQWNRLRIDDREGAEWAQNRKCPVPRCE